jgi:NtrC-family two-component system sensor histidine kinase KinB
MKKAAVNFKILLTLCFQLVIIIVLTAFANLYLKKLADSSANIVKDNLRSVKYCSAMQRSLYGLRSNSEQLPLRTEFENNLQAELNNITEPGEKELADRINADYFQWLKTPLENIYGELAANITSVNELNISAIEKKNVEAQEVATNAGTYITVISVLGGLAAFMFTFIFIGRLIQPPPAEIKN